MPNLHSVTPCIYSKAVDFYVTPEKMETNCVKVAVVQASPKIFDVKGTLEKIKDLCSTASKQGAKLVLFPEAFISCYPRGTTFGVTIGKRTAEGRELFRKYWESSVDVPGPVVTELSEISKSCSIHLVVGVIEREGGTLYCCILFFDDHGHYLGKHRKLMPTAAERLCWGFGDGSTLPVFDTDVGKVGAVICWENYMPAMRMAMYAKGTLSKVFQFNWASRMSVPVCS